MNKKESVELKAFAIILMFWHHLFGCGDGLSGGQVYTWHSILTYTGDVKLGLGCKLCVPLFAFCTGYGIYKSYICDGKYSKIISSIAKFLIQYWIILFGVAIPYLIFFHKFNPDYFFVNLFSLICDDDILYVSLSWYVKLHLLFLAISPVIKLLSNKIKSLFFEVLLYIVLPIIVSNAISNVWGHSNDFISKLLHSVLLLCTWIPIFYIGVIFAKYGLIEKVRTFYISEKPFRSCILSLLIMMCVIFIRAFIPSVSTDMFGVILFAICFDYIYSYFIVRNAFIDKMLYFLGDYSFQFWLLSGMFYCNTTEFFSVLYWPRWSPLILVWNFIILIPFAIITKKISMVIYNFLTKKNKIRLV